MRTQHEAEIDRIHDVQLAAKDAEIERLLTKSEKDKNTLLVSLEAATKEIERLKAQVKELSEAYQKAIGPIQPAEFNRVNTDLKKVIDDQRDLITSLMDVSNARAERLAKYEKLITELADALADCGCTKEEWNLIQRAREVTR